MGVRSVNAARALGLAILLALTALTWPDRAAAPGQVWFSDTFEGAGLWDVSGLWHLTTHRANSNAKSYYFGVEDQWTYDTGQRESGTLTTRSAIDLTATNNATLRFAHFLSAEGSPYDHGRVLVSTDGGANWTEVASYDTTGAAWSEGVIALSAFTPSLLLLRFDFDTVDALTNAYEGWYLDDVEISGDAEPRDLNLRSLTGPARVMAGDPFTLTVAVANEGFLTEPVVEVSVVRNGTPVGLPISIGALDPGEERTVFLNYSVPTNGLVTYEVTASAPGSSERALGDNRRNKDVIVNWLTAGIYYQFYPKTVAYWPTVMKNTDWLVNLTVQADHEYRFFPVGLTSLTATSLAGIDVLVFPDNGPTVGELPALDAWFRGGAGEGRGLVLIDQAAALGAYQGYLWPAAAGAHGHGLLWDSASSGTDQIITLSHKITENYSVGNRLQAYAESAAYFDAELPADTLILAEDTAEPRVATVVARQVAGGGKVAALGPFANPLPANNLRPLILDAMEWVTTPAEDHDVAALWVGPPEIAPRNVPLSLTARVTNDGRNVENGVSVEFRVDGVLQGSPQTVTTLPQGGHEDLSFVWTPMTEAEHALEVRAVPVPLESATANNVDTWKIATWDHPRQGKFVLVSDNRQLDNNPFRNLVTSAGIAFDEVINSNSTGWTESLANLMEYEAAVLYTTPGSNLEESRALRIFTALGGSLLITGKDSLVAPSPLESILGVFTTGNVPASLNFTVVDPNSPAVSGQFGTWPFGAYFWALEYDHDRVFARAGTDTHAILRLVDGFDKLTYRRVGGQGKAFYWNGDGEVDWVADADQGAVFKNVLKWMGLKNVDLEMTSLDLPRFAFPGETVYANFTLANRGILSSAPGQVRLLQNGTETNAMPIPALAPGASMNGTLSWSNSVASQYEIAVVADTAPGETFPSNNRFSKEIVVAANRPVKVALYLGTGPANPWMAAGWQSLARNFLRYGNVPVTVDTNCLNHDGVTYAEIETCSPDVIVLTGVGVVPGGELTSQEMTDLLRYTFRGHGLVSVGFTMSDSVPNNAMLGPVFGVRQDIRVGINRTEAFNLTAVSHPIARALPPWYMPRNNISAVPAGRARWNASLDLEGGTVVMASNATVGAVFEHRGLYLLTPWLDSTPVKEDYQLLYNAVTLSRFDPADVDVAPLMLEYPRYVEPNETVNVRAGIWNLGRGLIGSAVAVLSLDGVTLTAKEVKNITAGDVQTVNFSFSTTLRGLHNFTIDVIGVAGEVEPKALTNNNISVSLVVEPVVGRVRLGPMAQDIGFVYETLRREARARGYSIEIVYPHDFRPEALTRYDALMIPVPAGTYTDADLRTLHHAVAQGKGLFVLGSFNATLYDRVTGFAGINWTTGLAEPGISTNIFPHEVTRGVASIVSAEPELDILVSANATSVVEDTGKPGQRQTLVAVSEVPGRVAAMPDESMTWNTAMLLEDNARLAVNIIGWLVRADQRKPSAPAAPLVTADPAGGALRIIVPAYDEIDVEWYRVLASEDDVGYYPLTDLPVQQNTYLHTNLTNGRTYYYRLVAVDWFGLESDWSPPASGVPGDITPPDPPTGVYLSVVGPTTLYLRWDPSASADTASYRVWYAFNTAPFDLVFETFSPSVLDFTHPFLSEGDEHSYFVTAIDNAGLQSAPSLTVTGSFPDSTPPSTPTGLRVRPLTTGGALNVTWNANLDDTVRYSLYWDDGTGWRHMSDFSPRDVTGFPHSGLTDGSPYCYNITASDAANNTSPPSAPPVCGVPQVPGDLMPPAQVLNLTVVSAPEGEELQVTWDPVPDLDVLEYVVELLNGTMTSQVGIVSAPSTSFAHGGLEDGVMYRYRVSAVDTSYNVGVPSAIVPGVPQDTTPPQPPNLVASFDEAAQKVTLSWSQSVSRDTQRYRALRGTVPGVYSKIVADVANQTTQALDTDLVPGFTYFYAVVACDEVPLCSAPSSEVAVFIQPPTPVERPTNLRVLALPQGNAVELRWNLVSDPNVTSFATFRNATASPGFGWRGESVGIPRTTAKDTVGGLVDGILYCFTVQAVWATGERSAYADYACTTPADSRPPDAPTDLRALAVATGTAVTLAWTPEIGTDVQEQRLYRAEDPGFATESLISRLPAEVGEYLDQGLVDGPTYYYRLQVLDEVPNLSLYSNVASATPLDRVAPFPPRDLQVTRLTEEPPRARLIWEPSTDADAVHYTVYRSLENGTPVPIAIVDSGNEYVDSSVGRNTTYWYYVTASDEVPNESGRSNVFVFSTVTSGDGGGGGGGNGGTPGGDRDGDFLASVQGQMLLGAISILCLLTLILLLLALRRGSRTAAKKEPQGAEERRSQPGSSSEASTEDEGEPPRAAGKGGRSPPG